LPLALSLDRRKSKYTEESKASTTTKTIGENMPSKGQIISGAVVFALCMLAYNKVPAVRKILGGA
jgi:hypothetical protein